jgi:two-component system, response regulator FlrC
MSVRSPVLVIDDDPNLRETLALILEQAGYQVSAANGATAGLTCLQARGYALVFLDIKMPDREGTSLLPEIRRLHPNLPVLILTAHVASEAEQEIWDKHATGLLTKPIDPESILERVRALCSPCAAED